GPEADDELDLAAAREHGAELRAVVRDLALLGPGRVGVRDLPGPAVDARQHALGGGQRQAGNLLHVAEARGVELHPDGPREVRVFAAGAGDVEPAVAVEVRDRERAAPRVR